MNINVDASSRHLPIDVDLQQMAKIQGKNRQPLVEIIGYLL
jgi:hypothetical protein